MLDVAAVAGRVVDLRLLAAALGRDPASLLPVIDEGLAAQIVEASPGRPPTYRFVHDLVREALVDALPAERLARLHWHLGECWRLGLDAARRPPGTCWRAIPSEQWRRRCRPPRTPSTRSPSRAGGRAPGVDVRGEEVDVELLFGLGDARLRAGDWDSAGTAYEQAA
ncbi:MAG: hypothetical protein KY457_13550 [Actinobacteria bacterium]|nr:hypothetical protein [Actinomycetota bacterium]